MYVTCIYYSTLGISIMSRYVTHLSDILINQTPNVKNRIKYTFKVLYKSKKLNNFLEIYCVKKIIKLN